MLNDSLEQIQIELGNFKELEIAETCTRPVPGRGNPNAELFLIGEAPGAKEDLLGQPFVGRSGQLLTNLLSEQGIDAENTYITNIVKFRPPKNRDPNKQEKEACLPFLIREIKIVKPKIIATLGRHSMNFFFPDKQIADLHGTKIIQSTDWNNNQIFFPLYHPAVALYNPNMKRILQEDIQKLSKLLKNEL